MTPQSHFVVVAAIAPGREAGLRKLLAGMTLAPGVADPANAVLPFGAFERLHFARFAVLGDATMADAGGMTYVLMKINVGLYPWSLVNGTP